MATIVEKYDHPPSWAAQIVQLRYFAGLTIEQTAAALDISVRTVNRHWSYAKAWLFQEMGREG